MDGLPNIDHRNLNSRAFPLFQAGHIQDVVYKRYMERLLIKSKRHAEMKKKELYSIRGVFNNSSEIMCMVVVLLELVLLAHVSMLVRCASTSKLQTWHHPQRDHLLLQPL